MPHPVARRPRLSAFTLIELLTVIAIIGILAAIIIPTVSKVRQSAKNAQCMAKLREWGRIIQLYANENKGSYRVADWGAVSSAGPYYNYFTKSEAQSMELRLCTADPEYANNITKPFTDKDAWRPTYGMVQGSIKGSISNLAPENAVPLSKALNPSQYILMMDAVGNDNKPISGENLDDITPFVIPLTNGTAAYINRHGGKMINAVFGDGSIKRITYTATKPGDPTAIQTMRTTWFQLY